MLINTRHRLEVEVYFNVAGDRKASGAVTARLGCWYNASMRSCQWQCSFTPLPMTLKIRCRSIQYKMTIEKNTLFAKIIDFQKGAIST